MLTKTAGIPRHVNQAKQPARGVSATLAKTVASILRAPAMHGAAQGVCIRDVASGKTLCALNEHALLVPASNNKLLTSAAALLALGPDFRYSTKVLFQADANGTPRWILQGGGDPLLTSQDIEELAATCASGHAGVKGTVGLDDTLFDRPFYGEAWSWDDLEETWCPPICALNVDANVITLRIEPGAGAGDAPRLSISPPDAEGIPTVRTDASSAASTHYAVVRDPETGVRSLVGGQIGPSRPTTVRYANRRPGWSASTVFVAKMAACGVEAVRDTAPTATATSTAVTATAAAPTATAACNPVTATVAAPTATVVLTGQASASAVIGSWFKVAGTQATVVLPGQASASAVIESRFKVAGNPVTATIAAPTATATGTAVMATAAAEHRSPPLSIILQRMNKPSDNLIAECLFRTVGVGRGGGGASANASREAQRLLVRLGLSADELSMADGSGLSRHDLVSPSNFVTLLCAMHSQPTFKALYDSLPIAGVDGTLAARMRNTAAFNNCRAKTGSMMHVRCISGYVTTRRGRLLAFSLMANNELYPASAVGAVHDRIIALLANDPGL